MPTRDDFIKSPPKLKIQANGPFGSGKTSFALSFPDVYYIGTEPEGIEILRSPTGRHLLNNLVEYEMVYIDPLAGRDDIKDFIEERTGKLYQAIKRAHEMAKAGKVKTLVLDNLTYTAALMWEYMLRYKTNEYLTDKGAVNKLQMYGGLKQWLFRLCIAHVLPFPGIVVVTCHLKSESDEKMKKKKDAAVDVVPNIMGGFRDESEGLFTASLYLERRLNRVEGKDGKMETRTKFVCYTENVIAMGGSKLLAKNRHGLPPVIENVTYDKIMSYINGTEVPPQS